MEYVTSVDGTRIGYTVTGNGPPLVLVHGGLGDRTRWNPLIEQIKDDFTVYAMDRRGRGLSGDGADYSLQLEVEDVVAVASSIEGPVMLYGVSSGALYALEAAPQVRNLHKLALYEPAIPDNQEIVPSEVVEKLQNLIDEGNPEEAIVVTLRDFVGLTPDELEEYKSHSSWPARVASAHTIPREERTINQYRFNSASFNDFRVPTVLLAGTESPEFLKKSVQTVDAALPDSRVHVLHGQGHAADIIAPEMVAAALIDFLIESQPAFQ